MPCYDITNSPYIYAYITSQNINRSGEALSVRDKLQAQESVNDKIEFCKQYISNKMHHCKLLRYITTSDAMPLQTMCCMGKKKILPAE